MTASRVRSGDPSVGPSVGSIRRILFATDLSPASEAASIHARELARDLRAELLVVSVIDPSLPVGGIRGARVDLIRSTRELAAQKLVALGRHDGTRVTFLIWEGDPGPSIVEAADSEQVDMIVVGSHGRGSVGRFFVGSVSEYVVRHAPCPVLVVRGRQAGEPVVHRAVAHTA